ncbi:MAG: 8-amino-7-oxononanoate synthase, partial [Methylotetracoccus sp.]|nr:8-amino-7-oxononanoate synthase [Methylotetracoccus sp.]
MDFDFAAALERLQDHGLYRQRRVLTTPQGVHVSGDGQRVVSFCSNDYLGLANHPEILRAFVSGAERFGVGAGASHLVCGHTAAHHALEDELAEFTGRERALLFSTGYMANMGAISALAGRGGWVFEDRLNHASLLDGALVSGARLKRYRHADTGQLRAMLSGVRGGKWVVSDGVFSMDGDIAPVPALAAAARDHGAGLMIDDAHGLGVLGPTGGGTLEHLGLTGDDVPVLVGTLGKAFGTFGAFVAGRHDLIEFLLQTARTYIFTTAMPPAVAEATRAALRLVKTETWRRDRLRSLVARFRAGARQLGLRLTESETPIQAVLLGANERATTASHAL